MKRFSYFKAIFASFHSSDLYRDVARNWHGLGFRYLGLVFAMMGLFFIVTWMAVVSTVDPKGFAEKITDNLFERGELTFDQGINRMVQTIAQIPPMRIRNGQLDVEGTQPHFIYDPLTKRKLAVIDTTDRHTSLQETGVSAIFNATKITTAKPGGVGEDVFYLSDLRHAKNYSEQDVNLLLGILSQIPYISIESGMVSLDKTQPYFINHPVTDNELAIIDTTGHYRFAEDVEAPILITQDTVFIKHLFNEQHTEIYLPEANAQLIFDTINNVVSTIKSLLLWVVPLILFPLFMVLFFGFIALILLVYGGIGLGIAAHLKINTLQYPDLVRLGAVSFTPVLLLNLLLPQFLPSQGLIYFLISLGYLFFAINANGESQELKH